MEKGGPAEELKHKKSASNSEKPTEKGKNPKVSVPPVQKKAEKITDSPKPSPFSTGALKVSKAKWKVTFNSVVWAFVFFFGAFFLLRYTTMILETVAEKWMGSRLFIKRLIPIFRIVSWIFIIYLIVVSILAPPIETIIAITASTGIALGFAAQDILKNIFGGVMILFDRPFQVGDKIQVGKHYGEVIQIGLRSVRIVTADDSMVSVPNSEIVNQSVSNSNTGEFNCQVVSEIYLPVHVNPTRVRKIGYRSAIVSRYVYLKKPVSVIIKNEIHHGKTVLKVRLKAYVLDLRYEFAFMSDMTEIFVTELLKEGVVTGEDLKSLKE